MWMDRITSAIGVNDDIAVFDKNEEKHDSNLLIMKMKTGEWPSFHLC